MRLLNTFGVAPLALFICIVLHGANPDSKGLPQGVLKALAADEKDYCDQFSGEHEKDCHLTFRANLLWLQLWIAPAGQTAFLVENHNIGECGSHGCTLHLFAQQTDGKFAQVLGTNGETGELADIKVLKDITKAHYNIRKTWRDGKTQTL